ncbi:MAG TPA: MBL fold metallo-hydrolase [Xanthobacteraceae bacterium]|nr:MBL fold metallo-hydrolase [Xanthobacteraceae bacterium]
MGCASRIGVARAAAFAAAVIALASAPTRAQSPAAPDAQATPDTPRSCPGLVALPALRPMPVALRLAALGADQVRITYAGHATFLIESPQLVRIATDYNDYVRPPLPPDVVTMNHAHSTHYTDHPDPGIKLVLRGWRDDGKPAAHDVSFKDVHVRSVSTNIRDWGGGTERNGNSIFIFETANLCIAHLGHLHQTLTKAQLDEIGRVDVVMAPVDGNYTLDLDGMIEVLGALKAQMIIPMHFFSAYTLDRFLSRVRETYPVEYNETPSIVVSKTTLPARPTVVVLPGH